MCSSYAHPGMSCYTSKNSMLTAGTILENLPLQSDVVRKAKIRSTRGVRDSIPSKCVTVEPHIDSGPMIVSFGIKDRNSDREVRGENATRVATRERRQWFNPTPPGSIIVHASHPGEACTFKGNLHGQHAVGGNNRASPHTGEGPA